MSYKFLLFDLDHTLLDFARGEEIALSQFFESMGVKDSEKVKSIYRQINQGMWRDLEKGLISKKELINTRFSRTFAQFNVKVNGREMACRYQEFLARQGQIFNGADALLQELMSRGYHIYAATNGITYIQENRLQHSPISHYFTDIFISEQMGTQKPSTDFYEKIAERISGFERSKTLMIGDSLTADIQGGNNAGIDTVWYNPSRVKNESKVMPTYTIHHYKELLDLL
ncbi:YjjG family noncanonical pyrimidine nucleotidase [Streptococcus suis]|nr:YjjG family noncanonical pyrimidine nucleotidase [Streptococcus suis]